MTGKSVQGVTGKSGQREHWNIVPDSVLMDRELSFAARCVYSVLAGSLRRESNVARIGQRRIGQLIGMHQETVGVALGALHDRGHIEIVGENQKRREYVLNSNVFPFASAESRRSAMFSNRKVVRDGLAAMKKESA